MSPALFFQRPEAWPLLLLAPLAWLAHAWSDRRRARRLARAAGQRAGKVAAELDPGRRRLRRSLRAAGLLLALLALLSPAWGEGYRRVEQRGVDLLVALDVSRSMLAADQAPSRLAAAKREILALTERVRGDRMGLVIFAGEARCVVPLTRDLRSLGELLDPVGPHSVAKGGTDLGAALEACLGALEGATGASEAILLLTDGEDLEGRGRAAASACRERGIVVHCVGFGTAAGAKIPLEEGGGFLRDRTGAEVISSLAPASLRALAQETGGEYLEAQALPVPLIELYEKRVLPMARKSFEAEERKAALDRYQWPLLAGFLLWILALGATDRKPR